MASQHVPVTWQASTWHGVAIVVLSVVRLSPVKHCGHGRTPADDRGGHRDQRTATHRDDAPGSVILFRSLWRSSSRPCTMWGLYPVLLYADPCCFRVHPAQAAVKFLFNVGQYTHGMAAAWAVLHLAGVQPRLRPARRSVPRRILVDRDVVDRLPPGQPALVAGLVEDESTWWRTSPISSGSTPSPPWPFWPCHHHRHRCGVPLLVDPAAAVLLPLLAVQKTAEMSRKQEIRLCMIR